MINYRERVFKYFQIILFLITFSHFFFHFVKVDFKKPKILIMRQGSLTYNNQGGLHDNQSQPKRDVCPKTVEV